MDTDLTVLAQIAKAIVVLIDTLYPYKVHISRKLNISTLRLIL